MACDAVVQEALGHIDPGVTRLSAELNDYELPEPATRIFPLARARQGGSVKGILLQGLDDAALERLRFLSNVLGAVESCETLVEGQKVYVPVDPAPDCREVPLSAPGRSEAIAALAVREIMARMKERTADQLAGLRQMILARAAARDAARLGKPADLRSDTGFEAVEMVEQSTPHAGFFLTRSVDLRHPRFDGSDSGVLRREVFVATDAAIVLPYDPKRDRVLLVEQFRMGPYGRGDVRPWMLEPVAGRLDAGETPEATARRECEEEAGLTLLGLEKISSHYCSPGCSSEYFHLFLGVCDLPELTTGQGGLDSEDEDIRTHVISYEAAMGLLESGEADNGPLVLALLWLSKSRDRLRAAA